MKLLDLVTDTDDIRRTLRGLGEPTNAPSRAPARDPPFFKSHIVRRRFGQSNQQQMFEP